MRLKDKVSIITGSASGIGRATARLFAQEGSKVVVGDINSAGGEETVKLIKDKGGEACFVKADVSRAVEAEGLMRAAVDKYGRLDILMNNAGLDLICKLVDTTEEDWDRVIGVNLKGIFLCSKYAIPEMIRGGGGAIINISSSVALGGYSYYCAYAAAKGGVITLTENMAIEYSDQNIRVNCICPGATETPMLEHLLGREDMKAIRRYMQDATPLGRFGKPEDLASAALFMASDDASFITGHTLVVNGGLSKKAVEMDPEKVLSLSKNFLADQ